MLVFAIGGLGVKNASASVAVPLMPSLSEAIPHSRLYALEEGTRLFLPGTFHAMDAVLQQEPADTVVFYGMSTGTKEMLYLAAHLRIQPTARVVLFADSGPFDAYSAYTLRNDSGLIGLGVLSSRLRLFGGPVTNTLVDLTSTSTRRKSTDLAGRFRPALFWPEVERVGRDVWSRDGTPNLLRIGQLALIADASAAGNLKSIAAPSEAPPTWLFYLAPSADETVDGDYAATRYREVVESLEPGRMRFVKFGLAGLPHASERLHPDPYNAVIRDALRMVDAQQAADRR